MFFKKTKKNNSVLGVDFSSDEVRIVELERIEGKSENFKILNYIIKTLPKGVNYSDSLNPDILGQFMKDISQEEKLTGKRAVSAVSGASISTKQFTIPKDASERETESLIRNSSKTYHPKGIESMAFDFKEDVSKRTEEEKTIILKLCPIEAISTREDILNMAEMDSVIIDVDDNAIENISSSFDFQYTEETGENLGDSGIILIDIRKSKVITRTLRDHKVYNTEESIFKFSMKQSEDDVINDKIDDELKKMILLEATDDKFIKAIFLMGDNERLIKLKKYLAEDSEHIDEDIDVIISNPLVNIKYAGINPSEVVDAAPSLVLACGLAMRDISKYE